MTRRPTHTVTEIGYSITFLGSRTGQSISYSMVLLALIAKEINYSVSSSLNADNEAKA